LFASGDSITSAELVPACERALRLDPGRPDPCAVHVLMLEQLSQRAGEFDVIHFHIDHLHLPLARRQATPSLVTLHGRLDIAGLDALYDEFRDIPLVSISDSQRAALPNAQWAGTVYHGLPPDLLQLRSNPGRYLAFLGRICPEKGVDRAIEIAQRAGIPLKIAAKVDAVDQDYFASVIEPLIDGSSVQLIGEISDAEKGTFLGEALALLFPIDWPEPFGLVMIEAMACGTPVIAFRNGSVPEIVDEGITGFVVGSNEEAVAAVSRVRTLDRRLCRERFDVRFSASRMAAEYCRIYRTLSVQRAHARVDSAVAIPDQFPRALRQRAVTMSRARSSA
jgi:glycosyltransferase involved in cell wall biosynthesis